MSGNRRAPWVAARIMAMYSGSCLGVVLVDDGVWGWDELDCGIL